MSAECDRRGFLKGAGCFAGLLLAIGLAPTDAIAFVTGAQSGNERRYPIPSSDGVTVDRDAALMLVRLQGKVIALSMVCPHQNAAVKWLPSDNRFQCTRHDSKYTPDGTYTSGRATRNMDRYPIKKDGAFVVVDMSGVFRSDQNGAAWASDFVPV
jgi:Rieske Fe-S protein